MKLDLMLLFNVLLLFITFESVLNNTTLVGLFPYVMVLAIEVMILISLVYFKQKYFNKENALLIWPIKLFLIWNVICFVRGVFVAENYWEWKHLVDTGFVFLMPLFVYVFTNKLFIERMISFWLKYTMPLILVLIPFTTMTDLYGSYLAPFLLLVLLLPLLPLRWKVLVLFLDFIILTMGLDSRSNVIRFSIATFLGLLYYCRWFVSIRLLKITHIILMALPIFLLILGMTNIFNPFKMNDYIEGDYKVNESSNSSVTSLKADTRTFIYVETITSALKHNYVIAGRTPANGYDSQWFGNELKFKLGTGKLQRFASEVAILNIFTWKGLIGVALYFLIFLTASYLAIYRSNSYFMKIIGLFLAFRWLYAFVEDFQTFGIQYIILWLFIAMSYSIEFRKMNDLDFKDWIHDVLKRQFVFKK